MSLGDSRPTPRPLMKLFPLAPQHTEPSSNALRPARLRGQVCLRATRVCRLSFPSPSSVYS
ncbi:hypothetical protein N657DRAFT_405765 [Parathielavia appendiculata]|uniref:Uncharacterized protein n=1 Tax=Parathielavia appendiculata TaxID=2587402 RepID=A0AAN6TQ89_9PEZI|nr:hypothetical protein N657DRAFT_405765 [Parathielavia appendiculata]